MSVPVLRAVRRWECPRCGGVDVTHEARPHTRMHTCPKLGMLSAPMVPAGTKCKVFAVEREDWVGGDHVTVDDDGRPVMSVVVEREDGFDAHVFAPLARASRTETSDARYG